jgi:DNA-binding response OmpR family regulator
VSRYDPPMSPADCRLLMVEDDPGGREPMAAFLRRRGYTVVCAPTVAAGHAELARGRVTHLFLDLRLPDGSGVTLLEEAHRDWPDVKVAVVTGADRGDLVFGAVQLKPDAFLRKPVDFNELLAWVEGGPLAPVDPFAGGGGGGRHSHHHHHRRR